MMNALPSAAESEQVVIAACLLSPQLWPRALGIIRDVNAMTDMRHRVISAAARQLVAEHVPLDDATLWARIDDLDGSTTSDREGHELRMFPTLAAWQAFADELMLNASVVAEHVDYHAGRVQLAADRRRWARTLEQHARAVLECDDPTDALERAQDFLAAEVDSRRELSAIPDTAAEIFRSGAFTVPEITYATPWPALNDLTNGGIKSGQLTVLAAPTGSGKTGCGSTMALHFAAQKIPTLWITTELDNKEQAARFGAIEWAMNGTPVTPDDFLAGRMTAMNGAKSVDGLQLYVLNLDDPDRDPFDIIVDKIRAIRAATGKNPIVIDDYMQAHADEEDSERRLSLTKIATRLRRIARVYQIAVIAISSVSRAYYGKAKKAQNDCEDPIDWIAAAKESGDIEFACAVFIYLDTSDKVDSLGTASARLVVAKSRRGRRGFVGLRFHGPSGAFTAFDQAVEVMSNKPKQDSTEADLSQILSYLRAHQVDPPTRRYLRDAIPGMGRKRAEQAIALAYDRKLVVDAELERKNDRGHLRLTTVVTLTIHDQESVSNGHANGHDHDVG